jgi:hypothetical protein
MATDKPTVTEHLNGDKYWYVHDKLHRFDGPAVERTNGNKLWYVNGKCHRLDGPAVEFADGTKYWYVDGVQYSLADYLDLVSEEVLEDIVLNHLPGF